MSTTPVHHPGTIRVEGMLEGPRETWEPAAAAVADALRRAGAPGSLLAVLDEGGRVLLEPGPLPWPREQFAGDPAEALALALSFLFEEGPGGAPSGWVSTLRVLEFREDACRETLLGLTKEGIRTVGRDRPWRPAPQDGLARRVRHNLPVLVLVVLAGALGAFWKRHEILEQLRLLGLPVGEVRAEVAVDLPAEVWAESLRVEARQSGSRLEVRLDPRGEGGVEVPESEFRLEVVLGDGSVLSRTLRLEPLASGEGVVEVVELPADRKVRKVRIVS